MVVRSIAAVREHAPFNTMPALVVIESNLHGAGYMLADHLVRLGLASYTLVYGKPMQPGLETRQETKLGFAAQFDGVLTARELLPWPHLVSITGASTKRAPPAMWAELVAQLRGFCYFDSVTPTGRASRVARGLQNNDDLVMSTMCAMRARSVHAAYAPIGLRPGAARVFVVPQMMQ